MGRKRDGRRRSSCRNQTINADHPMHLETLLPYLHPCAEKTASSRIPAWRRSSTNTVTSEKRRSPAGVRVAHAHHEPRIPQGDGQDDRAAQRQPGCLFPTHPYSWQPRVELLRLQRLCDSAVGENARGIEPSMPCRSAHIASHNAADSWKFPTKRSKINRAVPWTRCEKRNATYRRMTRSRGRKSFNGPV